MKTINIERLNKLIDFLKELPQDKFDFDFVVYEYDKENECGTVCCAIGWTPKIFPDLVEWVEDEVASISTGKAVYGIIAEELFNIHRDLAGDLFSPRQQYNVHGNLPKCDEEATPEKVADMLTKFISLVEAGEIEGHEVEK